MEKLSYNKKMAEYSSKRYGDPKLKRLLFKRARKMLNSSPQPCHEIMVNRLIIDMAEQERVGLTFNRTVADSMADRWNDLESLNARFLQDVVNMEEQIKDDINKCERQIEAFLANRAQLITLQSNSEQMAGFVMHIGFYKTLLDAKIETLTSSYKFLRKCTAPLGFTHPTQIIDRYESLKAIFEEIFYEFEQRSNRLNKLQEQFSGMMEETIKKNMVDHNRMAGLHHELKNLKSETAELERFISSKLECSSNVGVILYKVKFSIFQAYQRIMDYKRLEPVECDAHAQLNELQKHMKTLEAVIKIVQQSMMNTFRKQNKGNPDVASFDPFLPFDQSPSGSYRTSGTSDSLKYNWGESDPYLELFRNIAHEFSEIRIAKPKKVKLKRKKRLSRNMYQIQPILGETLKKSSHHSHASTHKKSVDEESVATTLMSDERGYEQSEKTDESDKSNTTNNKNAILDRSNSRKTESKNVDQPKVVSSPKNSTSSSRRSSTVGNKQNFVHTAEMRCTSASSNSKSKSKSCPHGYQYNGPLYRGTRSQEFKRYSAHEGNGLHKANGIGEINQVIFSEQTKTEVEMFSGGSCECLGKLEYWPQNSSTTISSKPMSTEVGEDNIHGKTSGNLQDIKTSNVTEVALVNQSSYDFSKCTVVSEFHGNHSESNHSGIPTTPFDITSSPSDALLEKSPYKSGQIKGKRNPSSKQMESVKGLETNVRPSSFIRSSAVKPSVTFRNTSRKEDTLPELRLGGINKQYNISAAKRQSLKEEKIQVDKQNDSVNTEDKCSTKHCFKRSQSAPKLCIQPTAQNQMTRFQRFPVPNIGKRSVSEKTYSSPHLPQVNQSLLNKDLDLGQHNRSPFSLKQSELKSRRVLSDLCAGRRAFRDNYLTILSKVNLHSQRPPSMMEGEEQ
ncbi:hypothetical protein EGW08_003069 [Elysia chlorotica]|uniref:Uncharacterized protein n=1 Tax=Elysia chlorotica TaxID=188477 RepID=A0A3S1CCT2_ELYCH|nr:hypothetical protein EGW08_003069 [Elysia chlorotica]